MSRVVDLSTESLDEIHATLTAILITLRDNPQDLSNPEMFNSVEGLIKWSRTIIKSIEEGD